MSPNNSFLKYMGLWEQFVADVPLIIQDPESKFESFCFGAFNDHLNLPMH